MEWLARVYVHAMNCIHYMHDKYFYERLEMALHDRDIDAHHGLRYRRALGGRRQPVGDQAREGSRGPRRNWPGGRLPDERGRLPDSSATTTTGSTPSPSWIWSPPSCRSCASTRPIATPSTPSRADHHLQRRLRQATGNTPDGRRKGEPFAPGANPMHGRDSHGWLAACLPRSRSCRTSDAQDGISLTATMVPGSLRRRSHLTDQQLIEAAVKAFDAYFDHGGFHMNLNVTRQARRSRTRWSTQRSIRT
jgi:formate C-acetyltransferase